ncbi:MAG TPA: hypothetical protein VFS19_01110 [Planctomycetota bacterium]|nr:hypothetical protein [Planctomycetota bacterium]
MTQAGETIRQLHQRLVENVGSEQVAQAIEGGVALFIVLLVLLYLRGRFSKSARRRRSSGRRFRELAKVNRLPAGERQLLLAMARHLELDEPGLIFVRRSLFETAAREGGFREDRVDVLRRELYS